ncbi:MAG: LysR family transcriptional regulator, partial [Candidatus Thiodiazotropha sp.]
QPAISIAMRKLEAELNLTLLHRGDRRITPTVEGEVLLGAMPSASSKCPRPLNWRCVNSGGWQRERCASGSPACWVPTISPPILMGFKHRYPALSLSVYEQGTRRLQDMIRTGELDLGVVVADPPPEDLETRLLTREEMVVCVPREHPLAARNSICMEEFFSHELVVFKTGYFLREFIDRYSQKRSLPPKIAFETNLIPLTKAIVRQGFGITTFLRMVVEQDTQNDLVAVPFDEPVFLDLSLAWKKGGYLSRANQAFIGFVLSQTKDIKHHLPQ